MPRRHLGTGTWDPAVLPRAVREILGEVVAPAWEMSVVLATPLYCIERASCCLDIAMCCGDFQERIWEAGSANHYVVVEGVRTMGYGGSVFTTVPNTRDGHHYRLICDAGKINEMMCGLINVSYIANRGAREGNSLAAVSPICHESCVHLSLVVSCPSALLGASLVRVCVVYPLVGIALVVVITSNGVAYVSRSKGSPVMAV